MDQQEPPSNVLPLFPGIDTRPFGTTTEPVEDPGLADIGWNTDTGQVTLSEHEATLDQPEPRGVGSAPSSGHRRRARTALPASAWLALALLAGGAVAAGHALLSGPTTRVSHRLAVSHHDNLLSAVDRPRSRQAADKIQPKNPTRARPHRPRAKGGHPHATPMPANISTTTSAQPAVTYAPPPSNAPATPTYTAQASERPTSTAATVSASSRPASQSASQPAGPTGLGQQVGINCAPKCR